MAISNKLENFHMTVNEDFVKKADELTPRLFETTVMPVGTVKIVPHGGDFAARTLSDCFTESAPMGRGDSICLDFGDHRVGYVSFRLAPVDSPADAPAYIHLRFAEIPYELCADMSDYTGQISRSWIQEEYIHVDAVPSTVTLPRRYAFRYMQVDIIDTSPKYKVVLSDAVCRNVSAADMESVSPPDTNDEELIRLDRISLKTMQDCMQKVFEDGPKRDRRLWIGDMRLQALTNYVTFKNNDLVKRCLYLFAGLTQNGSRVGACLFTEPTPHIDDVNLFDYSLFFVSCLYDYYSETGDIATLRELYPTAARQIEYALGELDENGIVADRDGWWCFLDWGDNLNKQAGAHAILIYTLKQASRLAEWLDDKANAAEYTACAERLRKNALDFLWDKEKGFFVSGSERQISWASQIWFVLAGVFDKAENSRLLTRLTEIKPDIPMTTPYIHHYYVEAMFENGLEREAVLHLKDYWGKMIEDGADTFFEVYDPDDRYASPYGSRAVNSFCHAWSCTPSYFIRKYLCHH